MNSTSSGGRSPPSRAISGVCAAHGPADRRIDRRGAGTARVPCPDDPADHETAGCPQSHCQCRGRSRNRRPHHCRRKPDGPRASEDLDHPRRPGHYLANHSCDEVREASPQHRRVGRLIPARGGWRNDLIEALTGESPAHKASGGQCLRPYDPETASGGRGYSPRTLGDSGMPPTPVAHRAPEATRPRWAGPGRTSSGALHLDQPGAARQSEACATGCQHQRSTVTVG
jgi:hypothetical protein